MLATEKKEISRLSINSNADAMGEIRITIKLTNAVHRSMFKKELLKEEDVKSHEMEAVVDTGAVMLALPQDVVEKLELDEIRTAIVTYADERREELKVFGPIYLELAGRKMIAECLRLPPACEALIGQIEMEALDLLADCRNKQVTPRPESPIYPMLNLK